MKLAEGRSSWKAADAARSPAVSGPAVVTLLCLLCLSSGCLHHQHPSVEKMMHQGVPHKHDAEEHYYVGCPDVLDIKVTGRVDFETTQPVAVDGRIDLGRHGRPRVEGRNPEQIAALVAEEVGVNVRDVHVEVAEFHSQQVYLFGEVVGWQRAVPYKGQETVLDLLQRVGGISRGAAPRDVYLVRSHVADGQRPEVFNVDLKAIVLRNDQTTNIRVMPGDQIYVGETWRHRIERVVPPVLRPIYRTLSNTRLDKEDRPAYQRRNGGQVLNKDVR